MKTLEVAHSITQKQLEFINHQLIVDTINAAFQRAKIYKYPQKESDPNRIRLREELKKRLTELRKKYTSEVTETEHCQNIENLSNELTKTFEKRDFLGGDDKFRIGIAQKALNLYLKYLWCLGVIKTPPHCPFDNVVIENLEDESVRNIKWTKMDSIDDYKKLVQASKKLAYKTGYKTIAEWELYIWQDHLNS